MPEITASEVDSITIDEILRWQKQNPTQPLLLYANGDLTPKAEARLARLEQEAQQRPLSQDVDGHALLEKLQELPRDSPDSTSTATTAGALTIEETAEIAKSCAYKNYERLIQIGGRPFHEIDCDPGPFLPSESNTDGEYHLSDHWHKEVARTERELRRWQKFKKHQERVRTDRVAFAKYQDSIKMFMNDLSVGSKWGIIEDLQMQSKLDVWTEYHIYISQRRWSLGNKLESATQEGSGVDHGLQIKLIRNELQTLDDLLKWIEGEFSKIEDETNCVGQAQKVSSAPGCNRRPPRTTGRRGTPRTAQSVMRSLHASRVTKPRQQTAFPLGGHCIYQGTVQQNTTDAKFQALCRHAPDGILRRSQRIAKQTPRRSARIAKRFDNQTRH